VHAHGGRDLDDVLAAGAARLGQALEVRGELRDEPAGLGGANPGGDEQIVVGHSFTVMTDQPWFSGIHLAAARAGTADQSPGRCARTSAILPSSMVRSNGLATKCRGSIGAPCG
jgi:hypothetical protein